MKLLFDQNLSPKLVNQLADLFPNSIHVQDAGLDTAEDTEVWDYAYTNGYLVVSKDADFGAHQHRQNAQQWEEKAPKRLETAKKWLKDIIEKANEHDSFYRDLAERRLKNLEPR